METSFWVKRFFAVTGGIFLLLASVYLLKGRGLNQALTDALTWAVISAAIFIAVRIYRSRQGQHCSLCRDTPELQ